jgi:hypothetical protein
MGISLVVADPLTPLLATVIAVIGLVASVPVFGFFGVGVARSVALVRSRNCLGIAGGIVSFIPYLAGLGWSLAVIVVAVFFPPRISPPPDANEYSLSVLFALLIGLAAEGIGYVLQSLLQRMTRVAIPR